MSKEQTMSRATILVPFKPESNGITYVHVKCDEQTGWLLVPSLGLHETWYSSETIVKLTIEQSRQSTWCSRRTWDSRAR